jgi:hypothetical protein
MNSLSNEDIFKLIVVFLLLVIVFKLFAHGKEKFGSPARFECNKNDDCDSNICSAVAGKPYKECYANPKK